MSLHLFVQLYMPSQQDHLRRMVECISRNARLSCVEAVTVFSENVAVSSANDKINIVPVSGPMTFASMLAEGSELCALKATHFAVANTDILLTDDIETLLARVRDCSTVVALSRRESDGRLHRNPRWSQDFWLFKRHFPREELLKTLDFGMGIAGCEHLLAMSLCCHGYDIWNPCTDCRIYHHDPNPRTTFSRRLHGTYLLLPECKMENVGESTPAYQYFVCRGDWSERKPKLEQAKSSIVPSRVDKKDLRLHLCCGEKRIPGFLGVDIRPEVKPDIIASVEDLSCFQADSISEIYFCHGLEHVRPQAIPTCLQGILRILQPGGLLRMALPDFEALTKLYIRGDVPLRAIVAAIHGGQDYEHNIHYCSWDFVSLSKVLEKEGFVSVSRYDAKEFLPDSYFDWSLHQLCDTRTSLNIVCCKPSLH